MCRYQSRNETVYGCGDGCPFCSILNKLSYKDEVFAECGFAFGFPVAILTFQMIERLAKMGFYVEKMNKQQTLFLIEDGKEGEIDIPMITEIAATMKADWKHVACENGRVDGSAS